MAWNRPSEAPKPAPKKPSAMRGVVAGLVVVCALGGLCLWMFSGKDAAPKANVAKERGLIKEVTPAAAPKPVAPEPKPEKKVNVTYKTNEQGLIMRYEDGKPRWLHWRKPPSKYGTVKIDLTHPDDSELQAEDIAMKDMPKTDLFLAYLYNAVDGEEFGDAIPLENFEKRFLASLKRPIIVSHDDPDEIKEIKRGVIELRKELKDRYDAGEDIEAVVKATRDALTDSCQYRRQLQAEIDRFSKDPTMSEADVKDFISAANLMLEQKGSAKIEMSDVIRRRLNRRALKQKGE